LEKGISARISFRDANMHSKPLRVILPCVGEIYTRLRTRGTEAS
jgi:hypothetical protein